MRKLTALRARSPQVNQWGMLYAANLKLTTNSVALSIEAQQPGEKAGWKKIIRSRKSNSRQFCSKASVSSGNMSIILASASVIIRYSSAQIGEAVGEKLSMNAPM
ncbi:hypothetical protein MTR_8g102720 [Medicago truncatula]|uniref:Uncharacterized protein n=1 Tax=Medicago truncatula TaxID=3880 RepID=G7L7H8_MEDTR|nr:hypothetical protein MTR_8g102720 [Medicago truncatula]